MIQLRRLAAWAERPASGIRALAEARLPTDAFLIAGGVLVAFRLLGLDPWVDPRLDLHAYWSTRAGFDYSAANPFLIGAFLYSPAFAQAIAPFALLPWHAFAAVWTALIVAAYVWLVGRWAFPALFTFVVALELYLGQIDVFLAAAIVAGFRWPATWAFALLSKVAPGIGLLWFAVRREWRSLAIALGTTAAVVAVSAFFWPGAWTAWFGLLIRSATQPQVVGQANLMIPLELRFPIAVAVIVWGARTDRRWTVPVGVLLAMPILWLNVFTLLVAVIPLRDGARTPASEWLRGRWSLVPRGERGYARPLRQ